jgi:hypothetical protein
MNPIFIYLLGLFTPFTFFALRSVAESLAARKKHRRYVAAWDKFGKEFDNMSQSDLVTRQSYWRLYPESYAYICDDRSRYFAMRWDNGHTKEI